MNIVNEFKKAGIIPVITIEDAGKAEALAEALVLGGLPVAEVTFRTDAAAEAIRRMSLRYPDMLVGAGTVLTIEDAKRAVNAGAKFIVSPGLNPRIVQFCQEQGMPMCPGVATASEIEQAMELGITAVKFFPAEPMGGLRTIKALSAPYHTMRFMPTGGISVDNAPKYLAYEKIFAVGGSWIASSALLEANDFDRIRENAVKAAELNKR